MSAALFSSKVELRQLANLLTAFCRLPIAGESVPGALLEAAFGHIRGAKVLPTYDYVDLVDVSRRIGWSIKSTKAATPMTWKRAKITNKAGLIGASRISAKATQTLGDTLIKFCNDHAIASMEKYDLTAIGYGRLIVHANGTATYFERLLCTREQPNTFNPKDFEWNWSTAKAGRSKEQLSALHGRHRPSGKRWWAWHGLSENQLHFTGEGEWWPGAKDQHAITFELHRPSTKMGFDDLVRILDAL